MNDIIDISTTNAVISHTDVFIPNYIYLIVKS